MRSLTYLKKSMAALIALCVAVSGTIVSVSANDADPSLPAFPGAEGGGMWTTGARGDGSTTPEVYHVTKLTDDGTAGTFRDAVSESDRIIVFDVAGNIELTDTLTIKGDNLTILGQTAPGDGICVKNANTDITGNNVIMRYMRFRMGDELTMEEDTIGSRGRHNIIVDHCTFSWCVDECASFYEVTDFTMQWCIVSESLKESVHDKGSHGYGGIWGGTNASFHHNLLAHHDSRNPRISNGSIDGSEYDMSTQTELTDLRNNVIYNWGGNSAYGGQEAAPVNIINCYYKYGPATGSSVRSRIFQLTSSGNGVTYDWSTDLYVDGNYVYGSTSVTNDNSLGVTPDSSTKNYYVWTKDTIAENEEAQAVHFRYEEDYPVTTETAEEAYESVLASAGASVVRDSIDTRIIEEVKNGTTTYGTNGLINTPSDVGGYPELSGTKSKDSDNDGIPNEWEDQNGLDKFDSSDALTVASSGYLYIEEYANQLADGSYVRDASYDPDVEDYVENDGDDTDDEDDSPNYDLELVASWVAASGDENQAAGYEFMPGLVGMVQLERAMTDTKTYSDGFTNSYAITCKSTNSGWDAETGTATGCSMKYTASEDGLFTIYAYGVSVKDPPCVFYAVEEGVTDPTVDYLFSETIDESSKKILCNIEVTAGKTYYFYMAGGSKVRFVGAKFERMIPKAYDITALTAENGTVTANVTCNRENASAKLLLIGYDSNGILTDAKVLDFTSGETENVLSAGISGNKVKAFVWDMSTLEPLAKRQTQTIN